MKALNLYTLTRVTNTEEFSKLEMVLSGRGWHKSYSEHEKDSLCALVDGLEKLYREDRNSGPDWVVYFDGFYFSYTIEHISKEFDLLKLAPDEGCVLNIELKSEAIEEERIRKQLDQNRYYLSHIARTILSYTYVMETDTLYCLNDHGYLRTCGMEELAQALRRPALRNYAASEIGRYFRAQDYLISPVKTPEKFLDGRYFLTNQQSDFRKQILEVLAGNAGAEKTVAAKGCEEKGSEAKTPAEGREGKPAVPLISLVGNAGTGKTLLLLDLAMELSRKRSVVFVHGGPLHEGHILIDRRLHKVRILSGTDPEDMQELFERMDFSDVSCFLIDEANRLPSHVLGGIFRLSDTLGIPCIFSYDPHSLLGQVPPMEDAEAVIAARETLRLELSGNIRINRPVFSFLRTLFNQKDRPGHVDFSCIDVLYAADKREEEALTTHYLSCGYRLISSSMESFLTGEVISQEYDKVLMIMDERFYYDSDQRLCARGEKETAIAPLYEGLSRAREKLCLLIVENCDLFARVLAIRAQ